MRTDRTPTRTKRTLLVSASASSACGRGFCGRSSASSASSAGRWRAWIDALRQADERCPIPHRWPALDRCLCTHMTPVRGAHWSEDLRFTDLLQIDGPAGSGSTRLLRWPSSKPGLSAPALRPAWPSRGPVRPISGDWRHCGVEGHQRVSGAAQTATAHARTWRARPSKRCARLASHPQRSPRRLSPDQQRFPGSAD